MNPSRGRSRFLAASALVLAYAQAPQPALADDGLDRFLKQLSACTGNGTMTLAVAGFANDETALSRAQADEIRFAIETRLAASGRAKLAAAADVVRIKSLREGTTGLPAAEAEQQVANAFGGDASLFFVSPQRAEKSVRFRLQAMTKNADCKATSDPVEIDIKTSAAIADTDKIMAGAVEKLFQSARDVADVAVCPFAGAENGHSTCADALTDRLMLALDAKTRDPSLVLKDRKVALRRLPAGACAAASGGVTAQGQFDHDRQGQSWVSLEFRRGGSVLVPTGKTRISVEGLGCDPVLRPFLDHVAASAPADRSKLDVTASGTPFAVGQRLDIRIEAKAAMRLYCWVIAPDESAFIVLPVEGAEARAAIKPGTARYPSSFGLDDIVLQTKFDNLFSCFGVDGDLPEALHKQWLAYSPAANRDAALIPRGDVQSLMDAMRGSGAAIEATTRIVVR